MFIVFLILWYVISIRSIWVPGRPNPTVLKDL